MQVIGENPVEAYNCIISKLANISEIAAVTVKGEGASTFMVGTSEYALLLGNLIDAEAEITKAQAELKHLEDSSLASRRNSATNVSLKAPPQPSWSSRERKGRCRNKDCRFERNTQKFGSIMADHPKIEII